VGEEAEGVGGGEMLTISNVFVVLFAAIAAIEALRYRALRLRFYDKIPNVQYKGHVLFFTGWKRGQGNPVLMAQWAVVGGGLSKPYVNMVLPFPPPTNGPETAQKKVMEGLAELKTLIDTGVNYTYCKHCGMRISGRACGRRG
jgi:hypothetical protein